MLGQNRRRAICLLQARFLEVPRLRRAAHGAKLAGVALAPVFDADAPGSVRDMGCREPCVVEGKVVAPVGLQAWG